MVCPACPWALNESPMCQFGSPELHCALCPHETPAPHHGKQSWALATTVQKDPFRYIPKIRYDHCGSEFHKYFKPIKTAVLLFLCPMAILSSHSFPSHAPAIACWTEMADKFGPKKKKKMQQKKVCFSLDMQAIVATTWPHTFESPSGNVYSSK